MLTAEKVVRPPKNPTAMAAIHGVGMRAATKGEEIRMPPKKLPMKLTDKTVYEIPTIKELGIINPMPYRTKTPAAPKIATQMKLILVVCRNV